MECTSFDNCGDHSFVGVAFEDLNVTDEQRAFCDGDQSCIFDLAVTGDEEIAASSHNSSIDDAMLQQAISEYEHQHACIIVIVLCNQEIFHRT